MPGIYFHIPFCKQACYYCNFHFSTSLAYRDEMIEAMKKELFLAQTYFSDDRHISTIYFGGGTPSLLNVNELKNLLEDTKKIYDVDENAEITLEANPDDINEDKLNEWKSIGINRLSIGVQSFIEKDLRWMNRVHNVEQALRSIQMVKVAGITNYSVDLIYGTPTLDDQEWKDNIETLIALSVPHISCYALTVETGTALQKMIAQKKKQDVDQEKQAKHFSMLMQWMKTAGYEHYEISNFSLPGYRSQHNSSYWRGVSYIGIGPSAHSYFSNVRQWNISNNVLYIKSLQNDVVPFEKEELTQTQQLNEYVMTSLRTVDGLDLNFIEQKFGKDKSGTILRQSCKFQEDKKLQVVDQKLILTEQGKLFADGIAADLFFSY